jgi:hypothetical protein
VWIFFELVFVSFLFVETKGPTLEEIAKIFDGEEAEVARIDADGLNGPEKLQVIHVEEASRGA